MKRQFTGRDMTLVLVLGFGIVVAVNFFMATLATRGFSGVVVENSYVASQKFNDWLAEARETEKLGWSVDLARDGNGHLVVETDGVPNGAEVVAELRRPIGQRENLATGFVRYEEGRFRSEEPIPSGRWTVRLTIQSGSASWSREAAI